MYDTDIPVTSGTLKGIYLKIDDSIALNIDDYYLVFNTEGDCCSETYISDVVKNISLKNYPGYVDSDWEEKHYEIISIEKIELVEGEYLPRKSRQEEDEIYGIKILLKCEGDDPDSITIIYRNSSNGYYGGWMNISKQDKLPEGYTLIQYDFHNPF